MRAFVAFALILTMVVANRSSAQSSHCKDVLDIGFHEHFGSTESRHKLESEFQSTCSEHNESDTTKLSAILEDVPIGFNHLKEVTDKWCAMKMGSRNESDRDTFWRDTLSPYVANAISAWERCMSASTGPGTAINLRSYRAADAGVATFTLEVQSNNVGKIPKWKQFDFVPADGIRCGNSPTLNTSVTDHLAINCTHFGMPRPESELIAVDDVFGVIRSVIVLPKQDPVCKTGCENCVWDGAAPVCTNFRVDNRDKMPDADHFTIPVGSSEFFECKGLRPNTVATVNAHIDYRPDGLPSGPSTWNGGLIFYLSNNPGSSETEGVYKFHEESPNGSATATFTGNINTGSQGYVRLRILNNDVTIQSPKRPAGTAQIVDGSFVRCSL